ncbi:MAG: lysostaphin resistance A-like protein [Christensenellales bacterium]
MKFNEYEKTLYNDEDAGKAYLLALAIPILVGFILTLIFNAIAVKYGLVNFTKSPALYSIYLVLVNGSMLATYFIYNKMTKTNFVKASLIKFKFGWKNLLICVAVAFITLFGSLYLINYLFYLMSQIGYNPDTSLPLPLTNGWWLVLNLIVLAVIPAICEELLYRGIVMNGLRKFGDVGAIFISALFFALAHGSAMQFFYQFILGAVLGAIVIKTGSIVASAVVHFLNNAIVVIYQYIFTVTGATEPAFTPTIIAISFVVAIVAGLLLWLIFHFTKEYNRENSQNDFYTQTYKLQNKSFSSSKSILLFTTAMLVAVVLWCVGTFL